MPNSSDLARTPTACFNLSLAPPCRALVIAPILCPYSVLHGESQTLASGFQRTAFLAFTQVETGQSRADMVSPFESKG